MSTEAQNTEEQVKPPKEVKPKLNDNPTVKVVRPDGTTDKKRRSIDIGLSELILPPWTKNVTAVYKILSSERIDPATKLPPEVKDVIMPGSYMLYDKFESDPLKKMKLMRNLGRPQIKKEQQTGKDIIEDQIDDVEFVAGIVRVDVDKEFRKYVFMELHPLNKSNRHRSNDNAPYFERIDIRHNKSEAYIAAEMDLGRDAEELVMNMKDKVQIIGMAVTANVYQNGMDPGALKNILRKFAKENPRKFYKMTNNSLPGIRLAALDALNWGILYHDTDKRSFVFIETNQVVFTYLISEDPIEALVTYLAKKENSELKDELVRLVDYWE